MGMKKSYATETMAAVELPLWIVKIVDAMNKADIACFC